MANLVGIEIDAFSVRGAVVKTQFRRAQVVRYIEVSLASFEDAALLDAAPASDGTPLPHASGTATSRAIKELLRQAGSGGGHDCFALCSGCFLASHRATGCGREEGR